MLASDGMQRLAAENKGRRVWPSFRRALSVALDMEVRDEDRVSIDETAALRTLFEARLRSGRDVALEQGPRATLPAILEHLRTVGIRRHGLVVVLLHANDATTGAVRVPLNAVLANALRTWAVVERDLCLVTDRAVDGLCLEFSHLPHGDSYELHTWGALRLGDDGS